MKQEGWRDKVRVGAVEQGLDKGLEVVKGQDGWNTGSGKEKGQGWKSCMRVKLRSWSSGEASLLV